MREPDEPALGDVFALVDDFAVGVDGFLGCPVAEFGELLKRSGEVQPVCAPSRRGRVGVSVG